MEDFSLLWKKAKSEMTPEKDRELRRAINPEQQAHDHSFMLERGGTTVEIPADAPVTAVVRTDMTFADALQKTIDIERDSAESDEAVTPEFVLQTVMALSDTELEAMQEKHLQGDPQYAHAPYIAALARAIRER